MVRVTRAERAVAYCVRSVNTQVRVHRVRFNDRCRVIETTTTRPYIVRYIAVSICWL